MNLTQDFDELREAIDNLRTRGTTPMTEAIALTRKQVLVNSQNINVSILLTDGSPDNKRPPSQKLNWQNSKVSKLSQ